MKRIMIIVVFKRPTKSEAKAFLNVNVMRSPIKERVGARKEDLE